MTSNRSHVGGLLDLAALVALHRPAGVRQLDDAIDHARRALSALRAIDPANVTGDQHAAVGRTASVLVDVVSELDRVHAQLTRGHS